MDLAVSFAQLGREQEARAAAANLVELYPSITEDGRGELSKWFYSEDLVEHFIDGLRKAGLDIPDEED